MKKRLLACLLLLSMLFTGCNNEDKTEKVKKDSKEVSYGDESFLSLGKIAIAQNLNKNEKYDKAIEILSVYVKEHPYVMDAWIELSKAYIGKGDYTGVSMFDEWNSDFTKHFSRKDLAKLYEYIPQAKKDFDDKIIVDDEPKVPDVPDDVPTTQSQKVIVINSYNDEFKELFMYNYLKDHPLPAGYTYEYNVTKPVDYYAKLKTDLVAQGSNDEKIDLFVAEPGFMEDLVNSDVTKDLYSIGLSFDDFKYQFPYTRQLGTSDDGKFKASAWNAAPGAFVYNKRIAKEIFGTDAPDQIAKLISNTTDFGGATYKVCKSGKYKMLATTDEMLKVYSCSKKTPWVTNGKITIDNNYLIWAEDVKGMVISGDIPNERLWMQGKYSNYENVFGSFWSSWGVMYVFPTLLGDNTGDTWGVCYPTYDYYWGGQFLCAAGGGDNDKIVCDIIKYFTSDSKSMEKNAELRTDFPNNTESVNEMSKLGIDTQLGVYGGQQYFRLLKDVASRVSADNVTKYDYELDSLFQTVVLEMYIGNKATIDDVKAEFLKRAKQKYPELK